MGEKRLMRKNSIGMFNIFKGFGMLVVLLTHTFDPFRGSDPAGLPNRIMQVLILLGQPLMPAFFMISGYGFRKSPEKKCVKQQAKTLLVPYLYTLFATSFGLMVSHFAVYGYLPGAVKEAAKQFFGFLLGLPQTRTVFGVQMYGCGPCWFLMAMFLVWCIFNFLMNHGQEKFILLWTVGLINLNSLIGLRPDAAFCFVLAVPYIPAFYFGYLLKKYKFFTDGAELRWRRVFWGLCAVLVGCSIFVATRQNTFSIELSGVQSSSTFLLLGATYWFAAVALIYFSLSLNRLNSKLLDMVSFFGANSLVIFCIHTAELVVIPWYIMDAKFTSNPLLGATIKFALRLGITVTGCLLIKNWGVITGKMRLLLSKKESAE